MINGRYDDPIKQALAATRFRKLGASLACGLPLFRYLGGDNAYVLPVPLLDILNGGRPAHDGPDVQEFMIVPLGAPIFREALRYAVETYYALREILRDATLSISTGDEGGYMPSLKSNASVMDMLMLAIERAGYRPVKTSRLRLILRRAPCTKTGGIIFPATQSSCPALK